MLSNIILVAGAMILLAGTFAPPSRLAGLLLLNGFIIFLIGVAVRSFLGNE